MKLDLTDTAIVPESKDLELKSAFDMIEEVEAYLTEELDVAPLPRPTHEIPDLSEITEKADTITNEDLAYYLALFTQWASFIDYRLSTITASHKLAERNRKLMDTEITMQLYATDVPKTEVPQRVRHHASHVEYETEEIKLYCMKKILEARYKAYSKQAETISRLISLREQDLERQRIESGRQHRGKGIRNRRREKIE